MMTRTTIALEPETQKRARERATQLGISFSEYLRRLVDRDLGGRQPQASPDAVFDLGRSAGADIARDKDAMLGEATGAAQGLETAS